MSDTEGTVPSDAEEVVEFKCRKCPGKTFTAAEKDAHRMYHRDQKEKGKKKPGPKSKTRSSSRRDREPSPATSAVTLFEPVSSRGGGEEEKEKEKRSRNRRKASPVAGSSKRKSRKVYDESLIGEWKNGTGA